MKKRNSKSLWLTRGHRYDFGSWMIDQTKSSVNKAFNVDGVFDLTKASGSIGSTLGALGDIIGTSRQLGTITDTSDDRGLIQDFQNTTFSGNTTDSLLGQWNSTDFLDNQYDMEDIRGYSNGEMIGKIGGSIGKGALAGAQFGPIGALVGAAVGGISSGIGAAVGTNKAKREAEELARLQNKANAQVIDTFDSQAQQVNRKNALNRNIYANGGELNGNNDVFADAASGIYYNDSSNKGNRGYKEGFTPRNTSISDLGGKEGRLFKDIAWAGFETLPVLGNIMAIADVWNSARNLSNDTDITSGDIANMLLDISGLLPGVGSLTKGAKLARKIKAYKAADYIDDIAEPFRYTNSSGVKDIKNALNSSVEYNDKARNILLHPEYDKESIGRVYDALNFSNGKAKAANRALNPKYTAIKSYIDAIHGADIINDATQFTGELENMNEYKDGGSIHIKKKNKGKFTESAKRAGMGVQEYARHVLANKERYSPTLVKRANFARNAAKFKHDLGGFLFNHGAEWNNGVSTVDTGGTHSENPYGGIPMGMAPDNQPNLVEQGEVIYKDYVFSNRLAPTKDELKLVNLPERYNDWSFARIAEDMNRESSERPNDSISKRGLEDSLGKLMMIQEKQRMEKGKKGTQQMMAYGGHKYYGLSDFPYYNPSYDTTFYYPGIGVLKEPPKPETPVVSPSINTISKAVPVNKTRLNTYSNFEQLPENTPFYTPEYLGFWDYLSNNRDSDIGKSLLNDINVGKYGNIGGNTFTLDDILRLSRDHKKGPVHQAFLKYASDYNNNPELSDITVEDAFIDPATLEAEKKALQDALAYNSLNVPLMEMPSDELDSSLRYAPVVGSAIGYLQSAFADPDYEHANYLTREANRLEAPQVRFRPLNRYLRYNPIDRNYLLNQLKSQVGATRRMVRNAGTNPGTTMAGLLAADYNAQNAVGNNLIQMQQYNDALRQSIEDFNRGTDQYNSQGFLQSDMFNAESKANRDALRLSYMDRAAQMREQSDAMLEAVRSNNFSNLMTQLGQIGRENQDVNILEKMKASDLFGVLNDAMRGNLIGKNGGMLTKKNKRRKK